MQLNLYWTFYLHIHWSIHNHDGQSGLMYKEISNQFETDVNTMWRIMKENASKKLGYPRFFIVNDNSRMIEVNSEGANTKSTKPLNVQFLKTLNRVHGK